jgi:hypothetical protein
MSWVVESVFDQLTTAPCATVAGFGTNAPVPRFLALVGMLIVDAEPEGVGDGDGAGVGAGDGVGDGLAGEGVDE